MMNNENLIPFDQLTEDKQREIRSKGGKASVEARRDRKLIAEYLEDFLQCQVSEEKIRAELERRGVRKKDRNYAAACAMAILGKMLKGDMNAAKMALSLVGEMPKDEVTVNNVNEPQIVINFPDDGRGGYD